MPGRFRGVSAAVPTPFNADSAVDFRALVRHAKWLLSSGCDGLVLFGTTGESASLSEPERRAILEAVLESGVEPGRILVGTGCCAIADTVALNRHATACGVAGVLIVPPFFFKGVSEAGVVRYFEDVIERTADAAPSIYLYHIPAVSGVAIGPAVLAPLLARYPEFILGYKDSAGDWGNTAAVLDAFPRLDVFVGSEANLLACLRHRGAGCISATANIQPARIASLYRHWRGAEADMLQAEATLVRTRTQQLPLIAAVKFLLGEIHGDARWRTVRPPLCALDAAEGAALHAEIRRLEDSWATGEVAATAGR